MWVSFDRCPDLFLHTQSKSLNARALIQCSYKRYDPSLLSSHGRPRSFGNLSSAFREHAAVLISQLLYDTLSRGPGSSRSRELSSNSKVKRLEMSLANKPSDLSTGISRKFCVPFATFRDTCPPHQSALYHTLGSRRYITFPLS
jgi:hypothetical protein